MPRYDLTTTKVSQLLDDPSAVAVLERRYPGISRNPALAMVGGMSAQKALGLATSYASAEEVAALRAELERL